jgi:lipopolysaccharide exporter
LPSQSLKEATLAGVRWVVLARIASEVLALAGAVVLARLIPPAAFGRAAVAIILAPLATILTFEGFASALVQRETIDERHRRTATLLSLVGGATGTLLVLVLAHPVGEPLFGASTAALLELASPVFLLAAIGAVPRAVLWRRLDFRRTGAIDVASLFAGTAVAVGGAVAGLDATAIVLGILAQTAVGSALLLWAAPSPWPRWHGPEQREISAFGVPAAGAGLVAVLFANLDYAIVAARASALQAGLYWRAFQVGVVYQDKLSRVMMQLAFPVYSRTSDPEELRALHERATRVHAAVIFPLLALTAVTAPLLVPTVFGPAWAPAVVPTQILVGAGAIAAVLTGYPQIMLAIGRPRALLAFNVGALAVLAVTVTIAVGGGLVVLAVAVVGVHVAVLLGAYLLLLGPCAGLPLRGLAREMAPALGGCAALVPTAIVVQELLSRGGAPALVVLALTGAGGLAVYALTLRTAFGAVYRDLVRLAGSVLPAGALAGVRLRRRAPRPARGES